MTQRETIEPTFDDHGTETHPAFAVISASRISSSHGQVLFDSDIKHRNTVRITVQRASRKRSLNSDWVHPMSRDLIEVELSEAQWASFVSSMNTTGVPATLRRVEGDPWVPGLPFAPRLAQSMAEVKGAAERLFTKAQQAMADYEQAIEDKAGAKVIKEKRRALHFALANSESNMAFAAEMLNEHTENVVQKARADIEAMVTQRASQLGLSAQEAEGMLELPMLEGEQHTD